MFDKIAIILLSGVALKQSVLLEAHRTVLLRAKKHVSDVCWVGLVVRHMMKGGSPKDM